MDASSFDTLQAARALGEAGFNEVQAQAIMGAVAVAVGERIAAIEQNMATKDQLANLVTKDQLANLVTKDQLANMATKDQLADMATKDQLAATAAELRAEIAELRAEVAVEFKVLYRHLWVMSASIVGLTVTLVKFIP